MPLLTTLMLLIALKALIIGSDFSFYFWIKYNTEYLNWYLSRPSFEDYLKDKEQ